MHILAQKVYGDTSLGKPGVSDLLERALQEVE